MAATKKITDETKAQIDKAVALFNEQKDIQFEVTCKGNFAYLSVLDKVDPSSSSVTFEDAQSVETKVGRMEYGGSMDHWDFAVFKYSSEKYHPDEIFYPGFFELDGTLEGTLRAAREWHMYLSGIV